MGQIRTEVLESERNQVFDLLEAIVRYLHGQPGRSKAATALARAFNKRFEVFLVGYRFIDQMVTPIDSTVAAESVATASRAAADVALGGARHSLDRATELLSDRQDPDYLNSVKESISAVEAVVKKVTGEQTLGQGLKRLESAGLTLHPSLRKSWLAMYGWSSDEPGVRHGAEEAGEGDQALAKYMLITCSAFVAYLIEAGVKEGLIE